MNAHDRLFGLYRPGHSWLHRLPVGPKYLLVLAVIAATLTLGSWWSSLAAVAVTALLLLSTRLDVRPTLALSPGLWLLAGVLGAYQVVVGAPDLGAVIAANLVVGVYAVRLLILTTPTPDLLDALAWAAGPLRWVGLSPERFALAVGVMVRSIPHLVGTFSEVRDASRARGLERNPFAVVTPVVVRSVGYALATGEALAARGLGETRG